MIMRAKEESNRRVCREIGMEKAAANTEDAGSGAAPDAAIGPLSSKPGGEAHRACESREES